MYNEENNKMNYNNYDQDDLYNMENVTVEPSGTGGGKKPKKSRRWLKRTCAALLAAALVLGGGFAGYLSLESLVNKKVQERVAEAGRNQENEDKAELTTVASSYSGESSSNDVSQVVANFEPAVVAINCVVNQNIADIWGRQYQQQAQSSGSGIIIGQNSKEVLIVTNNHVVSGAAQVNIEFVDGTTASAAIKGTSSNADLAVVAVKIADLSDDTMNTIKVATLGNSDDLKVGEMAIAIGNALGYGQTVTVGYISALNREVAYEDYSMELIQTDAAINPGNSGGALLNARGEVIGINSVKYADTQIEGIGFAIPITDAIPIITELMNSEQVDESEQAYLGIVPYEVNKVYAEQFNMPEGIYVSEVAEKSPAEKAGILNGDIIVKINGTEIVTTDDLSSYLSSHRSGESAAVTIQRMQNGQYVEKEINVTFGSKAQANQ
ncbi:S1C family serine protease [Anaerolentibacter hominis]|uniref:S1C family serine protease n=1 Tax=Anaerolentibacter hominis TaxID=3079009 RepID=UPI0031B82510